MFRYLLALALASASAQAGDASLTRSLGFSADGKYYAFAQFGTQDGSGFAWAEVAVIDVSKNAYAASRTVLIREENSSEEAALASAVKQVQLPRFGIVAGKNLGRTLLQRLPTDRSTYTSNQFTFDYWAEGGASSPTPRYDVAIESSATEDKTDGKYCTDVFGMAPQLLKLSVLGGAAPVVLQNDESLPKRRLCAGNYALRSVTSYKNKLVIGVSYEEPGFEGPNVRNMIVTGDFAR